MAALNQETPAWSTKLLAMLTSNSIPPYMKKAAKFPIIDIPIDRNIRADNKPATKIQSQQYNCRKK